jgi:hypothetical protein
LQAERVNLFVRRTAFISILPLLLMTQCACIAIGGGYSSSGGWFLWPGGLGLVLLVLFLLFFLRGR